MTLTQEILQKLMELPHRGTGTIYEKKASEFFENVYAHLGLKPSKFEYPITKRSMNLHLVMSFLLVIFVLFINFFNIWLLTLISALLTVSFYTQIPFNTVKFLRRFFPGKSQNIYTHVDAPSPKATLVITGHYDTGNDYSSLLGIFGPVYNFLVEKQIQDQSNKEVTLPDYINSPMVVPNVAFIFAGIACIVPDAPAKLFFGALAGIPLIIGIFLLVRSNKHYAPGAFDNGVGTSMIVDLAAYFHQTKLKNLNVIFMNTGSEEGLDRGLVRNLNALNLDRNTTMILDLDCIGEDELFLIHSEPDYPIGMTIDYDRDLFDLLVEFTQQTYQDSYKVGSSPVHTDNQDLVHAGYRVMGLVTTYQASGKYSTNHHTKNDTFDKIKWESVEKIREYLINCALFLDFYLEDNKI